MSEFKGTASAISEIKENLDSIQATLEETLTRAEAVKEKINDDTVWAGEAQLVGAAFLDLVVQYHGQLAPADGGPVSQASESLQEYLNADNDFYNTWQEHVELMGIG